MTYLMNLNILKGSWHERMGVWEGISDKHKKKNKKKPPSKKVRRGVGWGEVVTVYHVA